MAKNIINIKHSLKTNQTKQYCKTRKKQTKSKQHRKKSIKTSQHMDFNKNKQQKTNT